MDNPYYEILINAALNYVSFRPRSEKELREYLQKKLKKWKVSGDLLLEKVVARMGELGYVDDEKFAAWWLEQRAAFRPKGPMALKIELAKHGVSRQIIESVLVGEDRGSFQDAAKRVVVKKYAVWAKLPAMERKKKVYEHLARRGFDSDTIGSVIDDIERK